MSALSGDGLVAVGTSHADGPAISWTSVTATTVVDAFESPFDPDWTVAQAVSGDGSTIVGMGSLGPFDDHPFENEAFRWTVSKGMQSIGTISPYRPGVTDTISAFGVSDDGFVIAGWADTEQGPEAFRWTQADGMQALGDIPGGSHDSRVFAMSADGSKLVGWATSDRGSRAAMWTQEKGFEFLGGIVADASQSRATAVSADGKVVVGWARHEEGNEAFRSTDLAEPVGLGDLPGGAFFSAAYGVSATGVIVGHSSGLLGSEEGFIWDPIRGMRSLTAVLAHDYGLGSSLPTVVDQVRGISRDGKVILGQTWIADLRDEPPPGDANFDGQVDLSDFGILKAHFGSGKYRDEGDFNADGKVTLSDFGVLKDAFGTPPATVPEPPAIGLALLALGSLSAVALVRRALLHVRRLACHASS